MISEVLQTSRWFYLEELTLPDVPRRRNSWYRKRTLYKEIVEVVKESPGISTGEVARKLGRPYDYISPLLFHLKKFGSLRYEPAGVERTDGLAAFAGVPCVRQMLSKLSSEKTKGPWLRRLFRYQEWLRGKGYFGSVTELLEDCRRAETEGKYRHVDLMQEYLNSFRGSVFYKDSITTIIKGFYRKNRAELPREKVTYDRSMLIMAPSSAEEYIRPAEVWRMVGDGRVPVRDKAIIAVVLAMGLDESTFVRQFNYHAYPQIVKALGPDRNAWDVKRAPVLVSLVRPKTQNRFYSFLPAKALVLLRDWLNVRRDIMGSEVTIRDEGGVEVSDPLFVTAKRRPVDEAFVAKAIRDASFTSGVQQRRPGVKRYRIHGHEFRDTFRTTCKVAGVDQAVAEFFIGHSIDALGYDKSPWVYPEHFRKQYLLVEPYLCGEEQALRVQEEKRKELEDRLKSLESSLARLTSELGRQVSSRSQGRSAGTSREGPPKKVVRVEEVDGYMEKGWEPVLTLPDGRVVMSNGG
jgi:integrase